jgi:hypothetical protein
VTIAPETRNTQFWELLKQKVLWSFRHRTFCLTLLSLIDRTTLNSATAKSLIRPISKVNREEITFVRYCVTLSQIAQAVTDQASFTITGASACTRQVVTLAG